MKSLEEFVLLVADQFYRTDVSVFNPDTRIKELDEWSSLTALSIASMITEEFEVVLAMKDITSIFTIEDLYNLVKSRM